MKKLYRHLTASLVLIAALGCSPRGDLRTSVSAFAAPEKVCRVAVLPFENQTRDEGAGIFAARVFANQLAARGLVEVEPEGEMSLFFYRNRIAPGQVLKPQEYEELAQRMGIDALISGVVLELNRETGSSNVPIPRVGVQVDLVDTVKGGLILSSFNRRKGDDQRVVMHFGVRRTLTGLLTNAYSDIFSDWEQKGVGKCLH